MVVFPGFKIFQLQKYIKLLKHYSFKDTVALQILYFPKIKIFISLNSCQFLEYLFNPISTFNNF